MSFEIRPYHPTDLTSLYRICLQTGDSGADGTHLFRDSDILGHYYAAPYAVLEPDLSFVLTEHNRPCGYVLGVRDSATFGQRCETEWFPPLRAQYQMPSQDDDSHDAKMIRAIHRGHDQINEFDGYPAHLHIDILPQGQGKGWGSKLLDRLLEQMRELSIEGVFLGVGAKNTRAIGFYAHYGFTELSSATWGINYGMKL